MSRQRLQNFIEELLLAVNEEEEAEVEGDEDEVDEEEEVDDEMVERLIDRLTREECLLLLPPLFFVPSMEGCFFLFNCFVNFAIAPFTSDLLASEWPLEEERDEEVKERRREDTFDWQVFFPCF